jgi:hypothetical protein
VRRSRQRASIHSFLRDPHRIDRGESIFWADEHHHPHPIRTGIIGYGLRPGFPSRHSSPRTPPVSSLGGRGHESPGDAVARSRHPNIDTSQHARRFDRPRTRPRGAAALSGHAHLEQTPRLAAGSAVVIDSRSAAFGVWKPSAYRRSGVSAAWPLMVFQNRWTVASSP